MSRHEGSACFAADACVIVDVDKVLSSTSADGVVVVVVFLVVAVGAHESEPAILVLTVVIHRRERVVDSEVNLGHQLIASACPEIYIFFLLFSGDPSELLQVAEVWELLGMMQC